MAAVLNGRKQTVESKENMLFQRKQRFKRTPSLHEKQMQKWTIGLISGSAVVFTVVFYLLNRHMNHPG